MTEFYKTAGEIVKQLKTIKPGETRIMHYDGYILCQGLISAFVYEVAQRDASINIQEYTFEWDNKEAQVRLTDLLPVTISRALAQQSAAPTF